MLLPEIGRDWVLENAAAATLANIEDAHTDIWTEYALSVCVANAEWFVEAISRRVRLEMDGWETEELESQIDLLRKCLRVWEAMIQKFNAERAITEAIVELSGIANL